MSFYNDELLCRSGKFGTIWRAANGEKSLNLRDYAAVNVKSSCRDLKVIVEHGGKRTPMGNKIPIFSLYLNSQLMIGIVRVYQKQVGILWTEAKQLYAKITSVPDTSVYQIDIDPKKVRRSVTMADPSLGGEFRWKHFDLYDFELEFLKPPELPGLKQLRHQEPPVGRSSPRPELGSPHTKTNEELSIIDPIGGWDGSLMKVPAVEDELPALDLNLFREMPSSNDWLTLPEEPKKRAEQETVQIPAEQTAPVAAEKPMEAIPAEQLAQKPTDKTPTEQPSAADKLTDAIPADKTAPNVPADKPADVIPGEETVPDVPADKPADVIPAEQTAPDVPADHTAPDVPFDLPSEILIAPEQTPQPAVKEKRDTIATEKPEKSKTKKKSLVDEETPGSAKKKTKTQKKPKKASIKSLDFEPADHPPTPSRPKTQRRKKPSKLIVDKETVISRAVYRDYMAEYKAIMHEGVPLAPTKRHRTIAELMKQPSRPFKTRKLDAVWQRNLITMPMPEEPDEEFHETDESSASHISIASVQRDRQTTSMIGNISLSPITAAVDAQKKKDVGDTSLQQPDLSIPNISRSSIGMNMTLQLQQIQETDPILDDQLLQQMLGVDPIPDDQQMQGADTIPDDQLLQQMLGVDPIPDDQLLQQMQGADTIPDDQLLQQMKGADTIPDDQQMQGADTIPDDQLLQPMQGIIDPTPAEALIPEAPLNAQQNFIEKDSWSPSEVEDNIEKQTRQNEARKKYRRRIDAFLTLEHDDTTFREMYPTAVTTREDAARSFSFILQDAARQKIILQQVGPYGEIYITQGAEYNFDKEQETDKESN